MPNKPNIVYILADDMGYGDVSCLNENCAFETPHLDRLAREGIAFTDAHSNSAVCTPTRYGVLTGRYCWRTRLKHGVLFGYSAPLIEEGRMTVPSFLGSQGYRTACVGKWHLGWEWPLNSDDAEDVDFTKPIRRGPCDVGFDRFFGISASLDMPPYVYVRDQLPTSLPDRETENTDSKGFWRKGPTGADFRHEEVLPTCLDQAVSFIEEWSADASEAPFFIYFPLPAPHTPILPTADYQGRSGTNEYGDFVLQVDGTVGRIMDALERCGVADNTLLVFTSDNGCSPRADYSELAQWNHCPSYHFRGHKADIFEGGHRIPFIARWPGVIPAGSFSDEIICLTDLLATCADILDVELPDDAGEDSVSNLPALRGESREQPLREATVHHSINGSFSIRQGKWKLEMCPGSGGWSHPKPDEAKRLGLPPVQLYDMEQDVRETTNLQAEHPEIVARLSALLESYQTQDRSVDRGR